MMLMMVMNKRLIPCMENMTGPTSGGFSAAVGKQTQQQDLLLKSTIVFLLVFLDARWCDVMA